MSHYLKSTWITSLALVAGVAMFTETASAADLVIGLQQEPTSLDPTADATASIDGMLTQNVYESLTIAAENGEVHPNLAKGWDVSDDGLTYTFKLNEGVKYHDGTDFDADDVIYSFDRAMAEDSVNPSKKIFKLINSMRLKILIVKH